VAVLSELHEKWKIEEKQWENRPAKLLIVVIAVIVITECVITFLVRRLEFPLPVLTETTIHVVCLIGIMFPVLYSFVMSPLLRQLTERRLTEMALYESEYQYRFLAENLRDVIWEMDGELNLLFVSSSVVQMFGYEVGELIGCSVGKVLTPGSRQKVSNILTAAAAQQAENGQLSMTVIDEFECVRKDGTIFWYEVNATLIFAGDARLQKLVGVTRNISDRKRAEEDLEKAYLLQKQIFASLNEAVFIVKNGTMEILDVNPMAEVMFGFRREELIGASTSMLNENEERARRFGAEMLRSYEEHGYFEYTYSMKRKDGTVFASEHSVKPIMADDGGYLYHVCVVRDISERVRAEERSRSSLREKELLLKEINHRVRNNLQIISSLLNLEAQQLSDIGHSRLFAGSQNRITALSLVYRVLSRSEDLNRIDFSEYLRNLVSLFQDSFRGNSTVVAIEIEASNVFLDIDKAIPCSLITNELVSNALKFAFPDGKKGKICIKLEEKEGRVIFSVEDNGIGLPQGMDIAEVSTLGLRLVNLLVDQLEGSMEIRRSQGMNFTLTFEAKTLQRDTEQ